MAPADRKPSLILSHLCLWQYGAEYIQTHYPAWSPVGFWVVIVNRNTINGTEETELFIVWNVVSTEIYWFVPLPAVLHIRVQRKRVLYCDVLPKRCSWPEKFLEWNFCRLRRRVLGLYETVSLETHCLLEVSHFWLRLESQWTISTSLLPLYVDLFSPCSTQCNVIPALRVVFSETHYLLTLEECLLEWSNLQ